jgi:hypothetical protein
VDEKQVQVRQEPFGYNQFPGGGLYPGLGPGGSPYGPGNYGNLPQVYQTNAPSIGGGSGFGGMGNFNIKDIKGIIDRMGGIEGVMATMNKVQKLVSTIQQMQPMIKLVMGSFLKKADNDDKDIAPRRRRKRARRRSPSGKRPSANRPRRRR